MKYLLLLLIPFSLQAQKCKLRTDEVDPYTKDVLKVTQWRGVSYFSNYKAYIKTARVNDVYRMYLTFEGEMGCFEPDSYVALKFEDGTIIKLENEAGFNCGDDPTFFSDITKILPKLQTDELLNILIRMSDGFVETKVYEEKYFWNSINCVSK